MAKIWTGDAPVLCLAHGAYDLETALRAQGWTGPAKVFKSKDELMADEHLTSIYFGTTHRRQEGENAVD